MKSTGPRQAQGQGKDLSIFFWGGGERDPFGLRYKRH